MKILFYLHSRFGEAVRDLDYPEKHPMGGSETAVLRLARELEARGHEIKIAVEYEECNRTGFDAWIVMRDWGIFAQEYQPAPLRYLWCQDDVDQPFLQPLENKEIAQFVYQQCSKVILPSSYAARRWKERLNLPDSKCEVLSNAVPTELFDDVQNLHSRSFHVYYSSTPQRGLRELIQAWPRILEKVPKAELFVASSMQTYNAYDDPSLQELFHKVKQLSQAVYLGALNQAELRKLAQRCRVLAYPCTFPETGCIAAMEAMAAGCVVVSNTRGALPETAFQNPLVSVEGDWLSAWVSEVCRILLNEADYLAVAEKNLSLAPSMSWKRRADQWLKRLGEDSK